MTYRDPLPDDSVWEEPPYLGLLKPERAQFYRQREDDKHQTPRWMNTASWALQAELQCRLFEKLDKLIVAVERLTNRLA